MDIKINPINTFFKGFVIAVQQVHEISSTFEGQSSGSQQFDNNPDKRKDDKLFDIFDEQLKQPPVLKLPSDKDTELGFDYDNISLYSILIYPLHDTFYIHLFGFNPKIWINICIYMMRYIKKIDIYCIISLV